MNRLENKQLEEKIEGMFQSQEVSVFLEWIDQTLKSIRDAHQRALLKSAKRVAVTFGRLVETERSEKDYLTALRDYLMMSNQVVEDRLLHSLQDLNQFGLTLTKGKLEVFPMLPDEIPHKKFVEAAALRPDSIADLDDDPSQKKFDVSHLSNPLVFQKTGSRYSSYKTFGQKLAVTGALWTPKGYTSLICLPTGGGKSLIPQMLAAEHQQGLTIVVIPTVALAIDQERSARDLLSEAIEPHRIAAYYSGSNRSEEILEQIQSRELKLLFISPEALIQNARLAEAVEEANYRKYLKNFVIDEAHVVIDWGIQFREDFQLLAPWRKMLLCDNPELRTFLLSATLTEETVGSLKKLFADKEKWIEIRSDQLRQEPRYVYLPVDNQSQKDELVLKLVSKLPHPMIIYMNTPEEAAEVGRFLENEGFQSYGVFTGETGSKERKDLIEKWINDQINIMVATSAFGIGVDKADVRTVLHLRLPDSANTYYQQAGRAGRDGLPCLGVMSLSKSDFYLNPSEKVLSVEKMLGRWLSLLKYSERDAEENVVTMNSSTKPEYNAEGYSDTRGSKADRKWNLYLLNLLQRYNLIEIEGFYNENKPKEYSLDVRIKDGSLFKSEEDEELKTTFETIRRKELVRINKNKNELVEMIRKANSECWSEMFFQIYDGVSEYCAGCNAHEDIRRDGEIQEPLLKRITKPRQRVSPVLQSLCEFMPQALIHYREENLLDLLDELGKQGVGVVIFVDEQIPLRIGYPQNAKDPSNILILNFEEYRQLKNKYPFYLSGTIAVVYGEDELENRKMLSMFERTNQQDNLVIHLTSTDFEINKDGKKISDFIRGPELQTSMLLGGEI